MFNRFTATVSFNIRPELQGQRRNICMESAKRTMGKKSEMLFCRTRIILSTEYIYSRSFVKRDLCKKKKLYECALLFIDYCK